MRAFAYLPGLCLPKERDATAHAETLRLVTQGSSVIHRTDGVSSLYQPGKRSGAWIKYRVNRGQEFVIGGYFPGSYGFDLLIVGYYDGDNLMYVARTRNGFVPASRRQVFSKLKHLVSPACPFVNLPETRRSRFGEELNAERMKKRVWLRPEVVAQIEFLEWTEGNRLRHSKCVGLREDKNPRSVVKEQATRLE